MIKPELQETCRSNSLHEIREFKQKLKNGSSNHISTPVLKEFQYYSDDCSSNKIMTAVIKELQHNQVFTAEIKITAFMR